MPLDWSPHPPLRFGQGGMRGTDCNLLRNAYKLINNIIVVYFKSLVGYLVIIGQYEDIL